LCAGRTKFRGEAQEITEVKGGLLTIRDTGGNKEKGLVVG